jgi:hypothetical protein
VVDYSGREQTIANVKVNHRKLLLFTFLLLQKYDKTGSRPLLLNFALPNITDGSASAGTYKTLLYVSHI